MRSILLAEDNPADVYLLRHAFSLESEPLDIVVAGDGEQAVDYISGRGAVIPDLIVLDLNLPKRDGCDVLRHIRNRKDYEHVPVVVLTSSDSPRDQEATVALGADCFITKPSDLDAFLSLGRRLLAVISRKEPGASSRSASPVPAT